MSRFGEMRKREWTDADREVFQAECEYLSERKLAWWQDPDEATVRRRAKKIITKRFDEILVPRGFEATPPGTAWVLESRGVQRSVGIQPSRAGDCCFINVGRVPNKLATLLGQKREVERLQRFFEPSSIGELSQLNYFDVDERPEILDKALEVLARNVIPWLVK